MTGSPHWDNDFSFLLFRRFKSPLPLLGDCMGLLLFCAFVMLQPQDLQILWEGQLLEEWTVRHRELRLDLSCQS